MSDAHRLAEIKRLLDLSDDVQGDVTLLGVLLDQATPESLMIYINAHFLLTWAVKRIEALERDHDHDPEQALPRPADVA